MIPKLHPQRRRSPLNRAADVAWGLLIGCLLGACGLIWIELTDAATGTLRAVALAFAVLALCHQETPKQR